MGKRKKAPPPPDILTKEDLTEDNLSDIYELDLGHEEWCTDGSNWIRTPPGPGVSFDESALVAMATKGTKVWLYRNVANEVVGFGSMGTSRWALKPDSKQRDPVALIPWIAVGYRFRSCPPKVDDQYRYSAQILSDLICEATAMAKRGEIAPRLGLLVHPINYRAIAFYKKAGFVELEGIFNGLKRMTLHLAV